MSLPYLKNHVVPIPGSTVTAYLAEWTREGSKGKWTYSLWTEQYPNETRDDGGEELIAVDTLDLSEMHGSVTPEQVANVAFLLEVEYKT